MLKKKEYTHLMLKFYVNTRLKLKVECHRTPSMVESRNRQQIRRAASLLSFHSACAWEQIIRRVLSSFLIRVCLRTTIQCMHPEMEGRPDVPNEFFADARGWSRTTDKTCRILQTNLFANTHGDGRTKGRQDVVVQGSGASTRCKYCTSTEYFVRKRTRMWSMTRRTE
jgi:hypothetical protein